MTDARKTTMRKHDDPAKLAATARFIEEIAGSKAEAHRLIDAAKVRGSPGRPTQYPASDAQVMFEVERLENEYRKKGAKPPKRRTLIKEMVAIAKRGPELREAAAAAEAARATDPYAAVPLLPDIARIEDLNLGDSEASAVQRIDANASLLEMLIKAMRKHRPDLAQHLPPDALEQVRKLDANRFSAFLELFSVLTAFLQKYPDAIRRAQEQARAFAAGEGVEGPNPFPKK